jgi:protein-tyrosine phosphatase
MLTPAFVELNHITHVLNCAYDDIVLPWIKSKLNYTCLHMDDSMNESVVKYLSYAEPVLDAWLRDPKCRTVFIHCQAGVNRSATIACAYASKKLRIPVQEVMNTLLKQRPCAFTNSSFVNQLLTMK